MLPPTVADNLKQNKTTSEMFDSATICFSEIADFKAWLHCILYILPRYLFPKGFSFPNSGGTEIAF